MVARPVSRPGSSRRRRPSGPLLLIPRPASVDVDRERTPPLASRLHEPMTTLYITGPVARTTTSRTNLHNGTRATVTTERATREVEREFDDGHPNLDFYLFAGTGEVVEMLYPVNIDGWEVTNWNEWKVAIWTTRQALAEDARAAATEHGDDTTAVDLLVDWGASDRLDDAVVDDAIEYAQERADEDRADEVAA